MRKKTGLLLAWMILGVLIVGSLSSDSPQLAKVEAEQVAVGTWSVAVNDTIASDGKAVRWNTPGTTFTGDFTISEPSTSVSVYIKAEANSASRVCATEGRQRRVGNPNLCALAPIREPRLAGRSRLTWPPEATPSS